MSLMKRLTGSNVVIGLTMWAQTLLHPMKVGFGGWGYWVPSGCLYIVMNPGWSTIIVVWGFGVKRTVMTVVEWAQRVPTKLDQSSKMGSLLLPLSPQACAPAEDTFGCEDSRTDCFFVAKIGAVYEMECAISNGHQDRLLQLMLPLTLHHCGLPSNRRCSSPNCGAGLDGRQHVFFVSSQGPP